MVANQLYFVRFAACNTGISFLLLFSFCCMCSSLVTLTNGNERQCTRNLQQRIASETTGPYPKDGVVAAVEFCVATQPVHPMWDVFWRFGTAPHPEWDGSRCTPFLQWGFASCPTFNVVVTIPTIFRATRS